MKPQGAVITEIAHRLGLAGWIIPFICVPNSPHIGVIPIPTSHGVSKQRYPDVLAVHRDVIRLVEVEPKLVPAVGQDIALRFDEMKKSLLSPGVYDAWRWHVERVHDVVLPARPKVRCDLVLCKLLCRADEPIICFLEESGIVVCDESTFLP